MRDHLRSAGHYFCENLVEEIGLAEFQLIIIIDCAIRCRCQVWLRILSWMRQFHIRRFLHGSACHSFGRGGGDVRDVPRRVEPLLITKLV